MRIWIHDPETQTFTQINTVDPQEWADDIKEFNQDDFDEEAYMEGDTDA